VAMWETEGFGVWAAVERASGSMVGYVGVSVPTWLPEVLPAVEVGWRLAPASRGKGLATEGAVAALDFGFETLGLDSVISVTGPGNVASWRVMERLGMRLGRRVMHPTFNVALVVYEITAGAWQDHRAQMGS
jgi:RimJ/RimL family protein N-acetyltransferase